MTRRFTLWRGETQVGWFDERAPVRHHRQPVGAAGFLTVDGDASQLEAIMQMVFPTLPGSPTTQHPVPPDRPPSEGNRVRMEQEVSLMPSGKDLGVPPELRYSIRAGDGQLIATQMIVLEQIAIPPGQGVEIGLPADAVSVWRVMFSELDRV